MQNKDTKPDAYELVQVHKCGNKIEVIVRNKNKYEAWEGMLRECANPKSVYPPCYFKEN